MKIAFLHGQAHKGSTYNIARGIIGHIDGSAEVAEFMFPKDFGHVFCRGCCACLKDEKKCPDHAAVAPIVEALLAADLIVLASPTYCYCMSGALKAFLEHTGYMWMEHRPAASMFGKTALVVSTSGYEPGSKKVAEQLVDSVEGWGISNVVRYAKAVRSNSWNMVPPPIKASIDAEIPEVAQKVKAAMANPAVSDDMKERFEEMRGIQLMNTWNATDRGHWDNLGWTGDVRPWGNEG